MSRFNVILQVLIVLGTLNCGLQARAEEECLSRSLVREVQRDIKFKGNAKLDRCNPKNVVFQVVKAIQFIKGFKGAGSTTGPFALNVLKDSPFEYFKKRVDKIVFVDREGSCASGAAAYVWGDLEQERGRLYICSEVYSGQSFVYRASALLHEARHFDGFHHVRCVRGLFRFSTEVACDRSYQEAGSYAVDVAFFLRVAQEPTMSPVLRRSARMEAARGLIVRFNSLPADLKDGAFLTDERKLVSFFDGKSSQAVLQLNKNQSLRYMDWQAEFPRIVEPGIESELNPGLTDPSRAEESFRKSMIGSARSEENTYFLYDKRLIVSTPSLSLWGYLELEVKFSQIKPLSIFERLGDDGTPQVIMTDRDGRFTVLPKRGDQLWGLRESDLRMEANTAGILKAQTWQTRDKDITLKLDGRLFFFDRRNKSYTPLMPENRYLDVVAPVVWSKSLQDL